MALVNRCAVTVMPRQPMLDWMHPFSREEEREVIQRDSSVYLLSSYCDEEQAWQSLRSVSDRIFGSELELWCRDRQQWPQQRDFSVFLRWFVVQFHPLVEDLAAEPLEAQELDADLIADLRRSLGPSPDGPSG